MTSALVIGGGSIARRHARILGELGFSVSYVTSQSDLDAPIYPSVSHGVAQALPDYVVVANETVRHLDAVRELATAGYAGRLLIEKPVAVLPELATDFSYSGVAYNLRFHPAISKFRQIVTDSLGLENIVQVEAYAGQWLADWRPERPVVEQYSAHASRGGGVLRDLSHELDLLQWIVGGVTGVFARGGRFGDITVDSDDAWSVLLAHSGRVTSSLQLNYFDRPGARFMRIVATNGTAEVNVTHSTVTFNGVSEAVPAHRDDSYRALHEGVLASSESVTTMSQAAETDKLILDIERSASEKKWIER